MFPIFINGHGHYPATRRPAPMIPEIGGTAHLTLFLRPPLGLLQSDNIKTLFEIGACWGKQENHLCVALRKTCCGGVGSRGHGVYIGDGRAGSKYVCMYVCV